MLPLSISQTAAAALLGATVICPVCLPDAGSDTGADARSAAASAAIATVGADTVQIRLDIEGMTCGSCATTARIVLERTLGVIDAHVSYAESAATVQYDEALTTPTAIIARLEEYTGYVATEAQPAEAGAP